MAPEVRRIPADSPDALRLVADMVAELVPVYGDVDEPGTPSATPEDFSPPGGAFVAVYADGRPVAGGGIKRLDASTAEIKRMYVVPAARSRGLARLLLDALEDAARSLGYRVARLDTASEQRHAVALYASAGYVEVPDYNGNPYATYWAEKVLA
jgi:GNAT superfamily N-acetyltransferase